MTDPTPEPPLAQPGVSPSGGTACTGVWRDYYGPTDGPIPDGAWLMRCDGCGELRMFTLRTATVLIPGRTP